MISGVASKTSTSTSLSCAIEKMASDEAGGRLQPRMHPLTLRFHDDALEQDYREAMLRQTMLVVRFGIVLAMVVYLLFALLDVWVAGRHAPFAWSIRSIGLLAAAGVFALSFTPAFERYRESIMALFTLLLGAGLLGVFSVVPDRVVDQYYVGPLLIIIGSYTVLGLRFTDATLVSLTLIGLYLVSELLFREHTGLRTLVNAACLFAAMIIAGAGGYMAERQRRLAHCRRRLIERAREESRHHALHDALTGLPNRRLLMERLMQALARDGRYQTHAALLFIDLDAFKPVNDTYGHVFGDKLLKAAAQRLLEQVRLTDTVARLGGDEFVILLEDLCDSSAAQVLRERILDSFRTPFEIDGLRIQLGMSIGVAVHPRDASEPRRLLEAADEDMYRMKQQGRARAQSVI